MSTIAIGAGIPVRREKPRRKRWTRAECKLLEESGLWEGQHFELIEGELYNKMGKGRRHTNALKFLRDWLVRVFGEEFIDTETSIDVALEDNQMSEPEPDIIVLSRFDSKKKALLDARAGIGEYWVLDVNAKSLMVHRNPSADK